MKIFKFSYLIGGEEIFIIILVKNIDIMIAINKYFVT